MRALVPLLSVAFLVGTFEPGAAQVPDRTRPPVPLVSPRYFAPGTFGPANERGDSMIAYLNGKELAGAREPSFAEAGPSPAFRLSITGGWGLIRLVRLERRDTGYVLVRKLTSFDTTGLQRRRLAFADSFYLSRSQVAAFERAFAAADFGRQPLFDNSVLVQFDGDGWLIEARDNGTTKVILRGAMTPMSPSLAELRRALNALSSDFLAVSLDGARLP